MKQLLKTITGSFLYGTSLPTSDKDYKVVYLPSHKHLLLGGSLVNKVQNTSTNDSKNTEEDTDTEYISLHTFVRDFVEGQTYALELAFCPTLFRHNVNLNDWTLIGSCDSNFYTFAEKVRTELLTKDCAGMIGYCLAQSRKYSEKGNRLNAVERVLFEARKFAQVRKGSPSVGQFVEEVYLKLDKYVRKEMIDVNGEFVDFLTVLDKKFNFHLSLKEAIERLEYMKAQYGERAKKSAEYNGADFKAIMHACRVILEAEQLLTEHKLTFPFTGEKQEFLLNVRQGLVPFEEVQKFIDEKIELVTELREKSSLPSKEDVREKSEQMLLDFLREQYGL